MPDSEDFSTRSTATMGLNSDATRVAAQVFAACTANLGIDGAKVFDSLVNTGSFKTALGITDDAIEGLYWSAHQRFQIGQYEHAEKIFRTLCALDRLRGDFWLGLGICCRVRADDSVALQMFDRAAALAPSNSIPHFHRFDIFMRQEKWIQAAAACRLFEANSDGAEHENIRKSFLKLKTALNIRRVP